MKKLISLFVAVAMLCGLCTVSAYAADKEVKSDGICAALGDVDNDGEINALDARLALRASVGLESLDEAAMRRADIVCDSAVKATDARYILRMSVELEEPAKHIVSVEEAVKASFAVSGKTEGSHCTVCESVFSVQTAAEKSTLVKITDRVNEWAELSGADALIKAEASDNKADIIINADGLWAEETIEPSAFDGFLTKLGDAVGEYIGEDDRITLDGEEIFADGKIQNTAVKSVLFDMGTGLFAKIADLGNDGVYGVYDVEVNGERIALSIIITGSKARLDKIKSFAKTVSAHISADASDGDLVIDIIAPDALRNYITERAGERDVKATLDAITIGGGLAIIESLEVNDIFGSQADAISRLCETVCSLAPVINKVLAKTTAYAELNDGTLVALNAAEFDHGGDMSFSGLVSAFAGILSEELLDATAGAFAVEDYYQIPVHLTVDMSSLGLMAGDVITETVYVNIHIF